MGVVNVTPDSFSDGGALPRRRRRGRARRASSRPRARTILDVGGESTRPGAEPVAADEELAPRRAGDRGARAARRRARRSRSTPRKAGGRARRRSRPARRIVNDVTALPRRPRDGRRSSPSAGADCCLMHMRGEPRTMQDDPRLRRRRRRGQGVPRGAARVRASPQGIARGADPARPGHRLRQDARAQPRAAAPPRRDRRARAPGRDRHLAQDASSAAAHRPRRAARPRSPARSPRTCSRSSAGRRVFRVHDVAPVARCARGGGCYVGGAMRRTSPTRTSSTDDDSTRSDEDDEPLRARRHDRDHRPLALHPPRRHARPSARSASGSCSTCASTSASCDATVTDRVEDTVDYAEVCQPVALVAQQRSYKTLERLCTAIADRLLTTTRPRPCG